MASLSGPIVILTGAGISKESGLSTFRDTDGLWSTVKIEDVATPGAFKSSPARVHEFYNTRRRLLLSDQVAPNAAHHALAQLEKEWPDEVLVITQNIDNLHERSGSENVLHMHGEMLKSRCAACGDVRVCRHDLDPNQDCPACTVQGRLRPHVVWFGELPLFLDKIEPALAGCSLFLSIGTSGSVYPAAGFIAMVQRLGRAHTAELNLEPSGGASLFSDAHYGAATETVPAFVDRLLGTC